MNEKTCQFNVREALEADISSIRDIFKDVYHGFYPYHEFCDENWIKRSLFNDDILMLVAENSQTGEIIGTASVLFDTGAHSDLLGEFGRLVVSPKYLDKGVGKALMEKRIEYIQNRLHVGIVETRTLHSFSQRISQGNGFAAVGFLPLKLLFRERENVALFVRHFGDSLSLRRNNPRIIPEAHTLAHFVLENCGLPYDAIVDESSASYPQCEDFNLEELTAEGLPSLVRIERGRVHQREVFGPMGLQYGYFRLQARHASYLIARERNGETHQGPVAGAIGYIPDERERTLRVFELITRNDQCVRFLFERLLQQCGKRWKTEYIEVDVSAYAPRMQRTLLELGFLPAAYVPAMVFQNVERLDIVKMVRLEIPPQLGPQELIPSVKIIADQIIRSFTSREVLPSIANAVNRMTLFKGLNEEQANRLAGVCRIARFNSGDRLFSQNNAADKMYIVIEGEVEVTLNGADHPVGKVMAGEPIGEVSFLTGECHSATATTNQPVLSAVITKRDLADLIRQRPDIGLVLFRNLAEGLGRKLQRIDADFSH